MTKGMNSPGNHSWDLLATYLRPRWPRVALLATLLFGGVALELINPQIVRGFIDIAPVGGAIQALTFAGILYSGVAVLSQVGILLLLFREDWRLGVVLTAFALVALLPLGKLPHYRTEYTL